MVKATMIKSHNHWQQIKQEADTLRALGNFSDRFSLFQRNSDHPSIVRFVDFLDRQMPEWAFGSMCFLIMERCAGGSLVQWIEKMKATGRRTTMDEAAVLAAQMVGALSYCHQKKIVHLDLKPANVFMLADSITVRIYLEQE